MWLTEIMEDANVVIETMGVGVDGDDALVSPLADRWCLYGGRLMVQVEGAAVHAITSVLEAIVSEACYHAAADLQQSFMGITSAGFVRFLWKCEARMSAALRTMIKRWKRNLVSEDDEEDMVFGIDADVNDEDSE
ncbi:hypothetical protein E3N88_11982 [Mikania micrantha]|uniref:Uncharacterized protein n=1 Tax=Mikania micrantha TaxID=192012 RepID=A0A5N6P675_9ASTR|nr:hypothetical protein E3N88_11982 [Mikania micrantha]